MTSLISSDTDVLLNRVRDFWNNHVHDWKVAKSPAGTRAFFEEIEAYRFEKLHYLPRLVNFSGYAGRSVLDVGCGVGNDLSRFAKGGARVTGIDLAPHSIDLARSNFAQRGLEGEFHVMDGEAMTFADDSFDVVYCHTVLHFTPNPERMLGEIRRVLKPAGTAIVMTVNRRSWMNLLRGLMKVEIDHLDAPVFRTYRREEFARLMASFDAVRIVEERFPVRTKVHAGWKAAAFNALFVDPFNLLPRAVTRRLGHHLLAFATKGAA